MTINNAKDHNMESVARRKVTDEINGGQYDYETLF